MTISITKSFLDSRVERCNLTIPDPFKSDEKYHYFKLSDANGLHKALQHSFYQVAAFDWRFNGFEFKDDSNLDVLEISMEGYPEIIEVSVVKVLEIAHELSWIDSFTTSEQPELGKVSYYYPCPYDKSEDLYCTTTIHEYITQDLDSNNWYQIANRVFAEWLIDKNNERLKEVA